MSDGRQRFFRICRVESVHRDLRVRTVRYHLLIILPAEQKTPHSAHLVSEHDIPGLYRDPVSICPARHLKLQVVPDTKPVALHQPRRNRHLTRPQHKVVSVTVQRPCISAADRPQIQARAVCLKRTANVVCRDLTQLLPGVLRHLTAAIQPALKCFPLIFAAKHRGDIADIRTLHVSLQPIHHQTDIADAAGEEDRGQHDEQQQNDVDALLLSQILFQYLKPHDSHSFPDRSFLISTP